MNDEWIKIPGNTENFRQEPASTVIPLYPGIELYYLTFSSGSFAARHATMPHIIQIHYCRSGQIVWAMGNGNHIYLNPGDFSLHTMNVCADSVFTFPSGAYQGLSIYVDVRKAADHPPESLKDNNMFKTVLSEKFRLNDSPVFLAGNEQTESIFSGFYDQPEALTLPYQKIKVLELLLYLAKMDFTLQNKLAEYQSELVESIRKIHDRLLRHMEQRITIEELSREYLINPTTLKHAFKSVYGTSLAAHIKEHRMEQAAKMLKETNQTIAEIAKAVGYDSQSKFTAAFKTHYKILPREYRKK